jgi:hypothetical protein
MTKAATPSPTHQSLILLSRLLLPPLEGMKSFLPTRAKLKRELLGLCLEEFDDLLTIANSHHVVVRGLEMFLELMREEQDANRIQWAASALAAERKRIERAVTFLPVACRAFEEHGYGVLVIKSLDHWPDLRSDLDLYTDAKPEDVLDLMQRHFDARIAPRSWGDHLAHKWNFLIPGLPEAVEVHIGRLGQTGEQVTFASSLTRKSSLSLIGGQVFRVPSGADRVMISTMQRMYRHFYFRLCDIVDTAALVEKGGIDYGDLWSSACAAGIWEGVATYLKIVSDYVRQYRGSGLDLPWIASESALFGGDEVYYARGFLRVPIVPQSARLYGSQLAGTLARGELHNGARLSLLPWLATAAVIGQKLTGSDKGIW